MASPVVASLAFGLLALRAEALRIMSASVRPKFMECPKIDDHLMKCRSALLSTPELNDVTLDPDSPEQKQDYDRCMLVKLGVTVRETLVWCEHRGSLARKMALCYEYLLRLKSLPITDGLIVKIIDEFQVCLEKDEGPVVALRKRPSKVSVGSTEDDHEYAGYKKRKPTYSESHEGDIVAHRYRDVSEESKEHRSKVPSVLRIDNYDHSDFGRKKNMKHHHRRITGKPSGVDYAKMPSNYFYPRKEHGLGNETTADAASKPTNLGIETTTYPAKQESKAASKP